MRFTPWIYKAKNTLRICNIYCFSTAALVTRTGLSFYVTRTLPILFVFLSYRTLKVRFPVVSLEFFIDIILPAALMALGLTQPLTEISTRNIFCGWRRPVRTADNRTTFMCRLSWNLGTSTSWYPQGLSRPVMGLVYFYLFTERLKLGTFWSPITSVS